MWSQNSVLTAGRQGAGNGQFVGRDPFGWRSVNSTTAMIRPLAPLLFAEAVGSLTARTSASLVRAKSPLAKRSPHRDFRAYKACYGNIQNFKALQDTSASTALQHREYSKIAAPWVGVDENTPQMDESRNGTFV